MLPLGIVQQPCARGLPVSRVGLKAKHPLRSVLRAREEAGAAVLKSNRKTRQQADGFQKVALASETLQRFASGRADCCERIAKRT